jgi:ribosome maturation protein Sdo1
MYSRIKELAVEAGLTTTYGSDREGLANFDYREFAKLIIAECIDTVDKCQIPPTVGVHAMNEFEMGFQKGVIKAKQQVALRFED